MNKITKKEFTHLKIHTQYSICEGALRTADLAKYCKINRIKAVGLCDSNNLCGALEFSESMAKSKTQPIIGTQINIQHKGNSGKIPLFAKNLEGYKNLFKLSSNYFSIISQMKFFYYLKNLIKYLRIIFISKSKDIMMMEKNYLKNLYSMFQKN